jgi:hypothetical protein
MSRECSTYELEKSEDHVLQDLRTSEDPTIFTNAAIGLVYHGEALPSVEQVFIRRSKCENRQIRWCCVHGLSLLARVRGYVNPEALLSHFLLFMEDRDPECREAAEFLASDLLRAWSEVRPSLPDSIRGTSEAALLDEAHEANQKFDRATNEDKDEEQRRLCRLFARHPCAWFRAMACRWLFCIFQPGVNDHHDKGFAREILTLLANDPAAIVQDAVRSHALAEKF